MIGKSGNALEHDMPALRPIIVDAISKETGTLPAPAKASISIDPPPVSAPVAEAQNRRPIEIEAILEETTELPIPPDASLAIDPPPVSASVIEPKIFARPPLTERNSCIGREMTIIGNLIGDGPAQIYGNVTGDVRASELLIDDGAYIQGNISAQNVTIRGYVKGTVRAVSVRLQGKGEVYGDIYHKSLAIEENARFEGASRRVDNPLECSTNAAANQQKQSAEATSPPETSTQIIALNTHSTGETS